MKSSTDQLVLSPDSIIDLQMHTVYSDGRWIPAELLDHLQSEGFSLAAITDHDRVDTIAGIQELAIEKGMPVIVATEMSASWKGQMTDILCYGFDPERGALAALAQDVLRRQSENTRLVYQTVVQQGHIPLTEAAPAEGLEAILDKPSSQQPHELVAFFKTYKRPTDEISVGRILLDAGLAFETTEVALVVDAAHHDGGVCLIAHPGREDFITYDVSLLDQLRHEVPIDGLEVYYPAHTPERTALYQAYGHKHNLLTSSGSDSHDSGKKPIPYRAEPSQLLLERLGIRIHKQP